MLQVILNQMISTLIERGLYSTVVYSGWGTAIDTLVEEYYDLGGEYFMVKQLEDLAYVLASVHEEDILN